VAGAIDPLGQRKKALDAFLETTVEKGYRIETHTDTHAIIVVGDRANRSGAASASTLPAAATCKQGKDVIIGGSVSDEEATEIFDEWQAPNPTSGSCRSRAEHPVMRRLPGQRSAAALSASPGRFALLEEGAHALLGVGGHRVHRHD
jgi:hypothetical protein